MDNLKWVSAPQHNDIIAIEPKCDPPFAPGSQASHLNGLKGGRLDIDVELFNRGH